MTNKTAVPFSDPVKAGDLILVAITQWVGKVSNVKDDRGDTFTPVVTEPVYATPSTSEGSEDGRDHDYVQLYYAQNVVGGSTTVTVSFIESGDTNVGIYEFSGLDETAALDGKPVFNIGHSQSLNGGTLQTTDHDLCFIVGVDDDGNNKAPSPGSQYPSLTDYQDSSDAERFYTEYLITPQGSCQADFSIDTVSYWAVVGAAFKP